MSKVSINLDKYKAIRIKQLAEERWKVETGGCTWAYGDVLVNLKTDREGRMSVFDAETQALRDQNYTCVWKTSAGWFTFGASDIKAMAQTIRAHIQQAFLQEEQSVAKIQQATTVEQVKNIMLG